jgi:SAM-dependent methyltransferase
MVLALSEIRRVLVPNGILIDLRPIPDRWHIEVVSAREIRETGRIQDLPLGLADDEAANRSITQAEQNRWFARAAEEFFAFYYSWDSPSEMEEWVEEEWHDFIQLDEVSQQATRSTWALGDADAIVRVKVKMLIARWKKEISGDDE